MKDYKEYIEREALLEDIENTLVFSGRPDKRNPKQIGASMVVRRIRAAAAADVAPVVHGRWLEHIDGYENYCECSVCHGVPDSPLDTTPYCPNCGAKMDLEGGGGA